MRKSLAEVAQVREVILTRAWWHKECSIEIRGFNRGRGAGRGFFRSRGKSDGTSRGAGHQMSFYKTEVNRESDDGIGNIYQNKVDSSLNSDSKDKDGVCYCRDCQRHRVRLTEIKS